MVLLYFFIPQLRFNDEHFPEAYVPTVFDTKTADLIIDGSQINLEQWDTAGQEGYETIRALAYPNAGRLKLLLNQWFPIPVKGTTNAPRAFFNSSPPYLKVKFELLFNFRSKCSQTQKRLGNLESDENSLSFMLVT